MMMHIKVLIHLCCLVAGIDLENIVYYRDNTHYFVMTAKKQSLLDKGVIIHVSGVCFAPLCSPSPYVIPPLFQSPTVQIFTAVQLCPICQRVLNLSPLFELGIKAQNKVE